ncbi:MAG TPA: hypothetical protein VHW23_26705 [Kofleriaceae bacterium]|jgi:hypothetical protein|nr:hypothetical protein [Kofleriaceae bacterium]
MRSARPSETGTKIELFLSRGDAGPALAGGLDVSALATAVEGDTPARGPLVHSNVDAGGDPNSLRDQGWGVIAPAGEAGDRLLALARPLIERRAADQDAEVPVYRVPPDMTAARAAAWIDRKLVENALNSTIPGYLLVLGRPDQVSFELQQVLGGSFSVGRVGFDADAGYEAYIDKLLRAQRAPAASPRAVYFTARDGSPATELGRRLLMQPCIADAEQQRGAGRFAAEITAVEDDDPARAADRLVEAAAGPGVVFSCSHGAGAPAGGWGSPERRRALQGALDLGRGRRLEVEALAAARFAPGGVWVMFACFGAGTPARSAYHHWLARLAAAGEHDGDLAQVLASLPAEGEPPFLAALPQAALASPDGPLAVIGHLDLAWSYGFCDVDKLSRGERHRRFHELVAQLVKGTRVGLALGGSLMRARNQVQLEISIADDDAAAAGGEPQLQLGHRWMVMQDLAGYIALGDPAARLAIPVQAGPRAEPAAAPAPAPAAEVRTATAAPAAALTAEAIQTAVHDLLAGRVTLDELAVRHGVTAAAVAEWRRVYTDAGLRAVAALAAAASSTR